MTRDEMIQDARERYDAGEYDADEYEVALLGIEYAHGEAMSAQDERAEA